MMKKINRLPVFVLAALLSTGVAQAKVKPEQKHSAQMRLLDSFLANHHYQNALLDDEKSKEILQKYIDFLDAGKYIFTAVDISSFRQYEDALDNFARRGELSAVFRIYDTYTEKRQAQIDWALKRLQQPFSENAAGTLQLDREKVNWANSVSALHKRWEQRLLNEWIVLRLAKQSDEKARNTLTKRYKNMAKHLSESRSDDVFQIYANAVTSVYDPHTNYFSPRRSEDFDINMSLSLEGIGAQLTLEDEIITIKELIAGGPAKQSGKLARNDKILAVAQGLSGAMEDVVGWRLEDAVRLIRGKRGTTVRLRIEKAVNNQIIDVVLIRDKIKLEESAAKAEIKGVEKDGKVYRIGIIDLPSFYIDFDAANRGEKNYRSTTRDVRRLIKQLQKDGIDGLMIDLRDNGGGSLAEAVDLTGLFFDEGPVVQVRRTGGDLSIHADEDKQTLYDGPLAVLINQNSASASEIFAGAIKDYERGVILGEPTFGKGTVQSIIDLARFLPSVKDPVGQLKMTIAMFYRVNGSSTQLKGVTPNIYIPNKDSYIEGGEREEEHALPWHEIKPQSHQQFNRVAKLLPTLQRDYEQDNADNPMMQNLLAMMAWQKAQSENTEVSLSLKKRKARREAIRAKSLAFQNAFRKIYGYPTLTADYWAKPEKDKTDAEINADEQYEVDPILSIATVTAADYVRLLKAESKKQEQ